jgi:hypothetical protein
LGWPYIGSHNPVQQSLSDVKKDAVRFVLNLPLRAQHSAFLPTQGLFLHFQE